MKKFIIFLITWVAGNLSIPFWMVGHVHLTTNVYKDIHEIIASFGMNIIVGLGFWLEWRNYNETTKSNNGKKRLK
jgi:hypothetical protein